MTSMRKPRPDRDYRQVVGSFFERLTRKIVRTDECECSMGDFAVWPINAGIEVKGGDNNHPFRLKLSQLDHHARAAGGFPFDRYLYCLFKYNNKQKHTECKGKSRQKLLARCRNEDEVCIRLALGDIKVFILDIEVLLAMAQSLGQARRGSLIGRKNEPILEVSHTYLERFNGDARGLLGELGLNHKKWLVEHVQVILPVADLLVRQLVLPVTSVLKPVLSRKMKTVFYPYSRDSHLPFQLTAT